MTDKQKQEINQFLTEEVFGKCWLKSCEKPYPDFFTPEGFFTLWEKMKEDRDLLMSVSDGLTNLMVLDPEFLAVAVARWKGWKEVNNG